MWYTGLNPLKKITRDGEQVTIPKGVAQRRLHKALLRYHDANNWPLIREALKRMGRVDLIGNGKHHLVPAWQPAGTGGLPPKEATISARTARPARPGQIRTQHTGLPPLPRSAPKGRGKR